LHGIVQDPQYGALALSQPAVMTNLLKDLLPDEPREAGLLVAAAQADLAGSVRGYVAQGLDSATAVKLTANSFVASTSHTQEASTWVVTELALALGLDPSRPAQVTAPHATPPGQPTMAAQSPFSHVTPPYPAGQAPPAAGAAATTWQAPGAAAARPAADAGARVAAIGAFAGALLVLIASLVPLYTSSSGSLGVFTGHGDAPTSFSFWLEAGPVVVLLAAIAAGISLVLPRDRPRARSALQGMLIAFGIQTFLMFGFVGFGLAAGLGQGPGGALGLLGGLAFLAGGGIGMALSGKRPAGASEGVHQ
jgi:hypothetical protein